MNRELDKINKSMFREYGIDISKYDDAFLARVLERRYLKANVENASEYNFYVSNNNEEIEKLFHSLNIN